MRCTHCGSIIPPGLAQCPICGARIDTKQAQEDYRTYQEYPKTNYQQGVPPSCRTYGYTTEEPPKQYATPTFHTYRKQLLTGIPENAQQMPYQNQPRDSYNPGGAFSKTLSDLPGVIKGAFTCPTDTLVRMIRREDRYTGLLIVGLSLIMAFLTGTIMVRGVLGSLFTLTSEVTGLELADSTASLNQGVSYLAGKVALPIGGIAAVCQLIAVIMPAAVTMVYVSVMRKVRFSFPLLSGFAAIITLPNLFALLIAAVCSVITPYLAILVLLFGLIFSYVLLCNVAVQLGRLQPPRAVPVQAALICVSELMKVILIAGIGGVLMSGVVHTLTSLTNSMSSLL
ncbi:MAG TPA: zinc ribbon domain-containing protein [Candidatus Limiplasma sp.]|nr:zinc ribbon domain-containing protein [Candidatus Limiplasma sp.]